ncbi:DsbE family thiol:disulfide interchange protein [Scleromatobacter humisilvae]|uniref:DsbE family thiol:disulfide interchange protein n=1 Tax=Scleromatobacter humisilvae TaxID=2897159 RepID=A0A9X1YK38_9BURK|nr:DsbE family thiol:disulfide interchange protein [Scleromatobacter humisilvae]MCK9687653.1 DsbE family thiol:disulfide interchange protein [Scleromatobacter humisilvae]
MKALKFIIPLAIFVGLAGFLYKGLYLDPREVPSPLIDKPAPEFALTQLDKPEATIRRADMLGKVWMLNVWASWCETCRDEHPYLVEFAKLKALPIYGLDYKDQREPAQAWLTERGNPYDASMFDERGRVGIDFGVYAVPETFIIDKQGVVRFKQIGMLTPEVLNNTVLPLIRKLNG